MDFQSSDWDEPSFFTIYPPISLSEVALTTKWHSIFIYLVCYCLLYWEYRHYVERNHLSYLWLFPQCLEESWSSRCSKIIFEWTGERMVLEWLWLLPTSTKIALGCPQRTLGQCSLWLENTLQVIVTSELYCLMSVCCLSSLDPPLPSL